MRDYSEMDPINSRDNSFLWSGHRQCLSGLLKVNGTFMGRRLILVKEEHKKLWFPLHTNSWCKDFDSRRKIRK